MPYNPISIANFFLRMASKNDMLIGHMKLQKLVYFAHGYYLAATKALEGEARPLIDEYFEAWPYGPVSRTIYEEFKDAGRNPIKKPGFVYDHDLRARIEATPPEGDKAFESVANYV